MPTFKISVREHHQRRDGKFPVSIRLTHNRSTAQIKTDIYIFRKQISKDFSMVKDMDVVRRIDRDILKYEDILLKGLGAELSKYTARELADFIDTYNKTAGGTGIDYVAFARQHIDKLLAEGRKSYAEGFQSVIRSVIDYFGREAVYIREINTKMLRAYMQYIMSPRKITRLNQYKKPVTIKRNGVNEQTVADYVTKLQTLFNAACDTYNDPDGEMNLITHNPFRNFRVEVNHEPEKRNLSVEDLRKIIDYTAGTGREGLARDVFLMSFYFIGMNTADIYTAAKSELADGRLTYNRNKTKTRRRDEAVMSVRVEPEVLPLLKKYRDPYKKMAFDFYRRYSSFDGFNAAVNKGLKQLASTLEIKANLSTYYARHTYATIAANKCGISESDVGLLLNHVGTGTDRHEARSIKVTRGYIGRDWSKIDRWHRQVLDFVKNPDK